MFVVRRLLAQRHLAALICAAALLLKLLVPTGYMIDTRHGRIAITICSGTGPATMTMEMPGMDHAMPGHDGKDQGKTEHGKPEMPCAFAGLSAAITGSIDAVQIAGLIAFVMALGLVAVILPIPSRPAYLRPPLRGPPATL